MWLLPTRCRIGNLKRFFRGCRETGLTTPGMVLVNEDELAASGMAYAPANLDLPKDWIVRGVKADCFHDAVRAVWDDVKVLPWIGLLQDDLLPITSNWDGLLVKSLNGWNLASASDGRGSGRMHGAIAWSGELARTMGWITPPGFRHLFVDDVWETLGRETSCWTFREDVITHHLNQTYGAAPDETAIRIRSHHEHDEAIFKTWLASDKDECVRKIVDLRTRHGIRPLVVKHGNVKICIMTPCGSGRYEGRYKDSMDKMMGFFREKNIPTCTIEERYNADVSLARAKLFSMFLRTNATHMLWIDDDMGWEPMSVMRMLAVDKDFVAAAGPKKSYPIKFAVNNSDDAGQFIPLQIDPETGLCDVSEIGLAFALITRSCAERMATAYQDLRFVGPNGEINWALFIPMVRQGRYLAEDFAFCQRWRFIGGKVYVAPDVRLTHTGAHTFEGKLLDLFPQLELKGAA